MCVVGFANAQRTAQKVELNKDFNLAIEKLATDTIMPTNWLLDSATYYTTSTSTGGFGGFLAGITTYGDLAKIQEYNAATSYKVEGALLWIPIKYDNDTANADNGSFDFSVYSFAADTPSVVEAAKTVSYDDIDTTGFTVAMLDAPVVVNGKYGAGIDVSATFSATSVLSLYTLMCTSDGTPQGTDLAWEQWSDGAMYKISAAWDGLDIDFAIFPIVDMNPVQDINELSFVEGVKVKCFPNPTTDVVSVEYAIENASNVSIKIANVTGQVVLEMAEGYKAAGAYTSSMNVNTLTEGTYFVTIEAGSSRIAQRIVVR